MGGVGQSTFPTKKALRKPFHEHAVPGVTVGAYHKVGTSLLAFLDHFILEHNGNPVTLGEEVLSYKSSVL